MTEKNTDNFESMPENSEKEFESMPENTIKKEKVDASKLKSNKLGKILQDAREARKMTLLQLSIETKIQRTYIENLEKSDYSELPNAVYIRGFLRILAKYLKLSEEKLLKTFEEETKLSPFKIEEISIEKAVKKSEMKKSKLIKTIIAIVIIVIVVEVVISVVHSSSVKQTTGNVQNINLLSTKTPTNKSNTQNIVAPSGAKITVSSSKNSTISGSTTNYSKQKIKLKNLNKKIQKGLGNGNNNS